MLPPLLPDMTLYSLIASAHRLNGAPRGTRFSQALFGSQNAGVRHDFPSHLDEFCARTAMTYGSPDDLVRSATVAPYFLRFRPEVVQTQVVDMMRGNTVERLKFILGMPAGPSRASIPFSYCADCVREDVAAHGFSYWHRAHQLPGVYVCQKHASAIQISSLRENGIGRTRFFLPDDREIQMTSTSPVTDSQVETLHRLATLSLAALEQPLSSGYSPQVLLATYRHGLKQNGLLTRGGRVRVAEFTNLMLGMYRSIVQLSEFNRIVGQSCIDGMLRLVRKPRGYFHTLNHLLLIDALFGSWKEFISTYEWEFQMELPLMQPVDKGYPEKRLQVEDVALISELARRYKEGEGTFTALSQKLGVDVSTAMRRLGGLGLIEIPRHPRILTAAVRLEVIQSLQAGIPLRKIAKESSLSRATIDRICNEQVGLHRAWRIANHEWKRTEARAAFESILRNNPGISCAELRKSKGCGYSWLSRHDSEWLRSTMPAGRVRTRNISSKPRMRVDWAARDLECLAALKSIESTIHFESWVRLKPRAVLRTIPKISFVPRLERLPESHALVVRILEQARIRRAGT